MKALAALLASAILIAGCMPPPRHAVRRRGPVQQAPCGPTVAPIANSVIYVSVPVNFNYNPKDRPNATQDVRMVVLNRLNQDGRANRNTFYLQNGSQLNFTLAFSYNNNSEIFTGGMQFSGWGQGTIKYFSASGQYNDPFQMATDLADQAYAFISEGWHDTRSQCAGR